MSCIKEIDRALEAFDSIDLTEVNKASLMDRVDTKYLLDEARLASMLRELGSDYRVLVVDGFRRSPYATLYFDTPRQDCYHQHHNGRARRHKFRMRTYAVSGITFFEVKTKTNKGRTVKNRISIPAAGEVVAPEYAAFAEAVIGSPIALEPQLWTYFRRITLVGLNAPERVTIDTSLEFRKAGLRHSLRDSVVAEVKQERATRDSRIRTMLRESRVRPQRLSKYCVGSALLDPHLKQNSFKSRLLKLPVEPSHR